MDDDLDGGTPRYCRTCLRALIADEAYARTFQTMGQYRAAILKHIDNQVAADLRAAHLNKGATEHE